MKVLKFLAGLVVGAVLSAFIKLNPWRVPEDDVWSEETDPATYEFERTPE